MAGFDGSSDVNEQALHEARDAREGSFSTRVVKYAAALSIKSLVRACSKALIPTAA